MGSAVDNDVVWKLARWVGSNSIDLSGESFSSGCIWDYDPVVDVVVIVGGERLVSK